MANRLFPDQIAIHGTSRHVLNDVLNRRLSAGVDMPVRGPSRTRERITTRPFKLVIAHDGVTATLNDVIQRVRIVSVRHDVLARVDNLDAEENGRQHSARLSGIRINQGDEPPVRAAERILRDVIEPRLEVAPAPDRWADILFDEERIVLVVGHKLRPLGRIRIFHVRARISGNSHRHLVHQRPPFLFDKEFIVRAPPSDASLGRNALHESQRAWRGTEISKHFKEDSPMAWLFLLVAGVCEIAWAIGLKYTEGFSRLLPTIGTVAAMVASIGFLGLALKSLPVGTAYAVWTGIGTIGTAALGIYLFNEPATLLRLSCIGLILSGIIGLKIT